MHSSGLIGEELLVLTATGMMLRFSDMNVSELAREVRMGRGGGEGRGWGGEVRE